MKYIVTIKQVLTTDWSVDCENEEQAKKLAMECWEDGDSCSINGWADTTEITPCNCRLATEEEIKNYEFIKED